MRSVALFLALNTKIVNKIFNKLKIKANRIFAELGDDNAIVERNGLIASIIMLSTFLLCVCVAFYIAIGVLSAKYRWALSLGMR